MKPVESADLLVRVMNREGSDKWNAALLALTQSGVPIPSIVSMEPVFPENTFNYDVDVQKKPSRIALIKTLGVAPDSEVRREVRIGHDVMTGYWCDHVRRYMYLTKPPQHIVASESVIPKLTYLLDHLSHNYWRAKGGSSCIDIERSSRTRKLNVVGAHGYKEVYWDIKPFTPTEVAVYFLGSRVLSQEYAGQLKQFRGYSIAEASGLCSRLSDEELRGYEHIFPFFNAGIARESPLHKRKVEVVNNVYRGDPRFEDEYAKMVSFLKGEDEFRNWFITQAIGATFRQDDFSHWEGDDLWQDIRRVMGIVGIRSPLHRFPVGVLSVKKDPV